MMMKKLCACLLLVFMLGSCGGSNEVERTQMLNPAPQPFDMLDPYGSWVNLPGRGDVWRPTVAYTWAPYTEGEWTWTDRGWMWLSDEPFGWIVYHYGNWDYEPGMGWVWVPGYDWFPARVRWYVSDQYVGWAPLPPPNVILPQPGETGSDACWIFVPADRFIQDKVGRYRTVGQPPGSGTVGSRPPDIRAIETWSGRSIPLWRIQTERVRHGTRDFLRVRPESDDLRMSAPPPPPSPPSAPLPMNLPRGQARGSTPPSTAPAGAQPAHGRNATPPPSGDPKNAGGGRPSGNTRGSARDQGPQKEVKPAPRDTVRPGR